MSYWKCAPEQHSENCHVKSIVRPPHVKESTTDPHHFKYNKPLYAGDKPSLSVKALAAMLLLLQHWLCTA